MGVRSYSFVLVLMASLMLSSLSFAQAPCPSIEVFFSPKGGCTEAIIREIANAKKIVLVQAYEFRSDAICKALLGAHQRGSIVNVILDKRRVTRNYSEVDFFVHAGIALRIDFSHNRAHDKVVLIDGFVVMTGSFNFSKSAEESNAENVLIIRDEKLSMKYVDNWKKHWIHSEKYVR